MRKLILIAAISLLATEADAGGSRSLSLAASSANQQAEQPATTAPAPPQAPVAPQAANVQTATTVTTSTTETTKAKRRQPSTEARVIRELHRHGIYW